jgi:tetratricopeptide (TPR) repeat protein
MKTVIALVLLCSVASSVALGDDKSKADTLFKQGKKLMAEKKYSDACEAFEQSMKLDPGIGTQLNIAKCYEDWGKLARALHAYQAAERMAKDANDSRADKIDGLVTELDPQVPRLTIHVPKGAATTGVTIDGAAVEDFSQPVLLDPGPHTLVYPTAEGRKKTKVVPVDRGGSSEVTIDLPVAEHHDATPPPPPPTKPVVATADPGHTYKLAAYGVGGAGVAAIAVSSYLTLSARSKYNDALKAHCGGVTNGCDDVGLKQTHDARHQANIATVVFSVGLAAVGGGVALYMLAPKGKSVEKPEDAALYVVPSVSTDGAGLVIGGQL